MMYIWKSNINIISQQFSSENSTFLIQSMKNKLITTEVEPMYWNELPFASGKFTWFITIRLEVSSIECYLKFGLWLYIVRAYSNQTKATVKAKKDQTTMKRDQKRQTPKIFAFSRCEQALNQLEFQILSMHPLPVHFYLISCTSEDLGNCPRSAKCIQ